MYDPIMRVLTVLEILQAREHVSGAELAARLEVNTRTVQRYIARLQDLYIPVESVRGVGGYYRLKPGFRLPPLMFTDEEALALALGLRALRHLGLAAFAPAAEGASAKIGRVLPEELRQSMQTVEEVVALEPGPWVISTSAELLMSLANAIRLRRRVGFEYRAYNEAASRREVEPYGVIHLDGRWYVSGYCLLRKDLRTFRIDRVSELEMTGHTFTRPAGFDIRTHMQRSMPFVQSAHTIDVWLDLPLEQGQTHFALYRVAMRREGSGTAITCGRDDLQPFAALLLSLGCKLVVRAPQALREALLQLAERAFAAAQS